MLNIANNKDEFEKVENFIALLEKKIWYYLKIIS